MFDFRHNIIVRSEFRYQRFLIQSSRSGIGWIILAVIMLLPALLTALIVWGFALFGYSMDGFSRFGLLSELGVSALIIMNVALYVVVILVSVALASNSVSRERVKKTWDVLILTNIDARQLVLGKWWASLHALNGDHAMLGILRIGMLGLLLIFADYDRVNALPAQTVPDSIFYVIPLTVIVILFTVIDAGFTVALGIISALLNKSGAVNTFVSFFVRVVVIGVQFLYFWEIARLILDNESYFEFAVLGLIVFSVCLWLTLWIAQKVAVYGEVTAP